MPEEGEKKQEAEKLPGGAAGEKRVDREWKEEAKREKERLAREAAAGQKPQGATGRSPRALPKPSLELLITNLAVQALIAMGEVANPVTQKQECDLDQAKHAIDLLGVIEEKTKGNLTDEEKRHLEGTLYDLRMRYVSMMQS